MNARLRAVLLDQIGDLQIKSQWRPDIVEETSDIWSLAQNNKISFAKAQKRIKRLRMRDLRITAMLVSMIGIAAIIIFVLVTGGLL